MKLDHDRSITVAQRARNAMVLFVLGGAWLGIWGHAQFADSFSVLVGVLAATMALFAYSYSVYKRNSAALSAWRQTPDGKRAIRLFHMINAAQWCAIFFLAMLFGHIGRADLILPAAIFVIGLHFFPLARIFAYFPHYITGVALVLFALAVPLFIIDGGRSNLVPLGAGIIEWVSAAWAISIRAVS